eukprot:CAMPEP_0181485740 /NCGR_PEP_ID=MMETSP1110-20121109/46739_1 /TAXON_ID=174948 /ORGANISM="Symbiodinium sp., Strain CCMP421" /LENGTH=143 /DNA_ID=CAMNT_0023611785 /DNA_START=201 /DNA_END=629 /DNA_ORIENTATION=+
MVLPLQPGLVRSFGLQNLVLVIVATAPELKRGSILEQVIPDVEAQARILRERQLPAGLGTTRAVRAADVCLLPFGVHPVARPELHDPSVPDLVWIHPHAPAAKSHLKHGSQILLALKRRQADRLRATAKECHKGHRNKPKDHE